MPCTITDFIQWYQNDNTAIGKSGLSVLAVPASNTIFELVSGSYRFLSSAPGISTPNYTFGRSTATAMDGSFTFNLPYNTETHPLQPPAVWNIILPDGRILSGVVPAVAGPLNFDTLVTTYGWVWTAKASFISPSNGVFAKGSAPFTDQDSIDIIFSAPFPTSVYEITLTPSLDLVEFSIPATAYTNKTQNGFTIKTSAAYTGSIDWTSSA